MLLAVLPFVFLSSFCEAQLPCSRSPMQRREAFKGLCAFTWAGYQTWSIKMKLDIRRLITFNITTISEIYLHIPKSLIEDSILSWGFFRCVFCAFAWAGYQTWSIKMKLDIRRLITFNITTISEIYLHIPKSLIEDSILSWGFFRWYKYTYVSLAWQMPTT